MSSPIRAKLWATFTFIRYPIFEYLLTFSNGDAQKLNGYIKSFSSCFLRAAKLYEEAGEPYTGYAYYNLANQLKSAYRFGLAKKYLTKARSFALQHNDATLMQQIETLDSRIDAKNMDIPDYLNGEG